MAKQNTPPADTGPTRQPEKTPPSAADAAPAARGRVGATTVPKPRRDAGLAWLVVLGMVVLGAVPLVVELHRPAAWTRAEATHVAISAETLNRKAPVNDAETSLQAWTPVYEGISRWDLPPGGVWLTQLTYLGLPSATDPNGLVHHAGDPAHLTRARLGSLAMALLFVASVYWAGHSIGGVTTGAFSALAAMTMPLLVGVGRHATPDAAAMACSTLSIAGALWAMRPLRAAPALGRQLIGWLVCGGALGLAALTTGPSAVPATLACALTVAVACPRRISHVMGLLTSSAIAALMLTPWALHVHDQDPGLWRAWLGTLSPDFGELGWSGVFQRAGWRLSLAAGLCGLWLVWLIPAVCQPFSTSSAGPARRRMLLGWAWLAASLALLAFSPGGTRLGGLLIAVAPASVAIGLAVQQLHELSAEGRHARLWGVCRWLSCGVMSVLAIALPLLGYLLTERPDAVAWLPSPERPLLLPMHWSYYAGTSAALLLITALAARFAYANLPGRTVAALAAWLIVGYALAALPITRGPLMSTPASPAPLERLNAAATAQP